VKGIHHLAAFTGKDLILNDGISRVSSIEQEVSNPLMEQLDQALERNVEHSKRGVLS